MPSFVYFCFEHGIEYKHDDLMCPQCENEICYENDKHFKEKNMANEELVMVLNESSNQYKQGKHCSTYELKDRLKQKEKQMSEEFKPQNTTYIQEESVTNFMAALGYEPVYGGALGHLLRFSQPRFAKHGEAIVSVNRAIKLHNAAGEEAFAELIAFTAPQELRDYVHYFKNYQTLMMAAAGATKIVEQVKASFSRKKGFVVHDHNIKFMTRRDQKIYAHCMGF